LAHDRLQTERIDVEFVLQTLARDLSNPLGNPYPLPYHGSQNGRPAGFILAQDVTINRTISRSLIVIQGVAAGESPDLATIWGMIGQPALSVAYPMWVKSGTVPMVLNAGIQVPMYVQVSGRTGQLYPLRNDAIYIDSRYLIGKSGIGLFTYTLPLESSVIQTVEGHLLSWRDDIPGSDIFAAVQGHLADSIYQVYRQIPLIFPEPVVESESPSTKVYCYPNPFNTSAVISLSGFADGERVELKIFNLLGQIIHEAEVQGAGGPVAFWNGRNLNGDAAASGVYLVNAASVDRSATTKIILMR
jgi:hypothetical protein